METQADTAGFWVLAAVRSVGEFDGWRLLYGYGMTLHDESVLSGQYLTCMATTRAEPEESTRRSNNLSGARASHPRVGLHA